MGSLEGLVRYRYLLWQWTAREVRVRYKQSLLGAAWAVLQPLALMAIFTMLFSRLVPVDTGGIPYPVFAYVALVPWTAFSTSLSMGIPSLVNNMNLVTKIYFPREILPLGTVLATLLDLAISALVLAVMLAAYRVPVTIAALWLVPLVILQLLFTTAMALIGSALLVFFRDVRFVVPLLLQVWMYVTPVVYPVELVPEQMRAWYWLNPMAGIVDGYRRALVMGVAPQAVSLYTATALTIVLFIAGFSLFRWLEPHFADVI